MHDLWFSRRTSFAGFLKSRGSKIELVQENVIFEFLAVPATMFVMTKQKWNNFYCYSETICDAQALENWNLARSWHFGFWLSRTPPSQKIEI